MSPHERAGRETKREKAEEKAEGIRFRFMIRVHARSPV